MKTKKELLKEYIKKGYDAEKDQGFFLELYIFLFVVLIPSVIVLVFFNCNNDIIKNIIIFIIAFFSFLLITLIIKNFTEFCDYIIDKPFNNIKDILENEKNNIHKLKQLIRIYKKEESIFEKKDLYNEIQNMINVRDIVENEKNIFKILTDFEKNIDYTLKTTNDLDKYLNKHKLSVKEKECVYLDISETIENVLSENNVNLIDDTYILLYKPNLLENTDLKLYDNFYNIYQKNNIKRIEQKGNSPVTN